MCCVCFLRGRFYERNSLSHEHRSTARYARQRRGYPWASCWRPSPPKRQERNERKGKFTMKLYFGNAVTTATTLMILALLGYIGFSVWNRGNIACWGRRTLLLLVFGLVVCCFAAARDGLDKTIHRRDISSLSTAWRCFFYRWCRGSGWSYPIIRQRCSRPCSSCGSSCLSLS